MSKLDYTYHSHTKRCGHAFGEDEEYVLAAIEMGFKVIGFSDHVILPDRSAPRMRGDPLMLQDYFDSVNYLKKKYQDLIEIHLAFEAEWFGEEYEAYYRELLKDHLDYMILGQHCWIGGEDDCFHWYAYPYFPDKPSQLKGYVDDLIAGMRSGLFTYVCHPDLFMLWYGEWDERCVEAAYRIARTAKELDLPLEVNMGRSHNKPHHGKRGYPYPYGKFWDIVSEVGAKAIIGLDAHSPEAILCNDGDYFLHFVKKHKLRYVNRLFFKKKD